jgi:hypothetical protein
MLDLLMAGWLSIRVSVVLTADEGTSPKLKTMSMTTPTNNGLFMADPLKLTSDSGLSVVDGASGRAVYPTSVAVAAPGVPTGG